MTAGTENYSQVENLRTTTVTTCECAYASLEEVMCVGGFMLSKLDFINYFVYFMSGYR